MKRKRDKKTQEAQVPYADKYLYGDNYSDKYDYLRNTDKKNDVEKELAANAIKRTLLVLGCILVFCLGYFFMAVMMERNALPEAQPSVITPDSASPGALPGINDVDLSLNANYIPSHYLDGGAMTESVIRDAIDGGFNAVMFDLKRENGTLAYDSKLTSATTYNAVASPGSDVKKSVEMLLENNIIPLARIYCFSDSTAAVNDKSIAVTTSDGGVWRDAHNNAWLNPYSSYAVKYLTSVALEVQELGITNIIVSAATLPDGDLSSAVFEGAPGNRPEQSVFASFLEGLRSTLDSGTRLLSGTDYTISAESEIQAVIDAFLASGVNSGDVPVFTLSIPLRPVVEALSAANINRYIFIISAQQTQESTDTENQE